MNRSHLIPYTGDASLLAHCLRASIAQGGAPDVIEARAFKAATGRTYERTELEDARHMSDAWTIIQSNKGSRP